MKEPEILYDNGKYKITPKEGGGYWIFISATDGESWNICDHFGDAKYRAGLWKYTDEYMDDLTKRMEKMGEDVVMATIDYFGPDYDYLDEKFSKTDEGIKLKKECSPPKTSKQIDAEVKSFAMAMIKARK